VDAYDVFLAAFGAAILATAVLPRLVRDVPVSLPIVHLLIGVALYLAVSGLPSPDPLAESAFTERAAELVVIVSLMAAGLKIDRPMGVRRWSSAWRLLAVAMPLTIAATAFLGWGLLGLVPASALLLGSAIAPTDPVLASEVQVGAPNEREEHEVRFALTAEAGLNDALAFPFTNAAIAMVAGGAWFGGWLADDVVLKLASGLATGFVSGRLLGALAFRSSPGGRLAHTVEGIAAVGATITVYGVAELLHGYGFLAVFVAAVVLRGHERDHEFHAVLHDAASTVEQLGSALLMILVGGAIAEGGLAGVGAVDVLVAVLVVGVVRPVTGWLSLVGGSLDRRERWVVAAFGIRGMGSVYYLAHAAGQAPFEGIDRLWGIVLLVIVLSVVVHGLTAARAVTEVVGDEDEAVGSGRPAEPS
jgi:NhaP-type Na+/H+ or K+/H+ antiporter